MRAPCKDCWKRTLTCHSVCKEYKEFQKQCETARAARYAEQQVNSLSETTIKRMYKRLKRKNWKGGKHFGD